MKAVRGTKYVIAGLLSALLATGCMESMAPADMEPNTDGQSENDQPGSGQDAPADDKDDGGAETPDESEGGNDEPQPPVEEPNEFQEAFDSYLGIWSRDDGLFAKVFNTDLEILEFREDGKAISYYRDPNTNLLLNMSGFFAPLFGDIVSISVTGTPKLVQILVGEASLEILEGFADTTNFSPLSDVPDDLKYRKLETVDQFQIPFTRGDSYLGFDGTNLFFTESEMDMEVPVNPDTGVVGALVELTERDASALQDMDIWRVKSGDSSNMELRDAANVLLDEVDTNALGEEIRIEGATFDPDARELWLNGRSTDDSRRLFLRIDADAEPDVLLSTHEFDVFLHEIAWGGSSIWALLSSPDRVIEIDLNTFEVINTYKVPTDNVTWRGIQIIGEFIYLLGTPDFEDDTTIIEKVVPRADEFGTPSEPSFGVRELVS